MTIDQAIEAINQMILQYGSPGLAADAIVAAVIDEVVTDLQQAQEVKS